MATNTNDAQGAHGQWIRCGCHAGIVADSAGGPAECKECDGTGRLWRYSSGHLALYPGGPFRGKGHRVTNTGADMPARGIA